MSNITWVNEPDENKTYVCKYCTGKVEYDIVSTKTDISEYAWICQHCFSYINKEDLHLEIKE